MKPIYPLRYRAALLAAYQTNPLRTLLSLQLAEKTIEAPAAGQLLVQMEAAPCNPSDIAFMQGGYNVVKPLPAVPGFEGVGVVADVGPDLDPAWIGQRVSVFIQGQSDGTWAEFVLVSPKHILPAPAGFTVEQAAMFFINPFTAWGLMEIATVPSVLMNAAGSRLGEYVLALSKQRQMHIIGIVRKEQTSETLIKRGFDSVLISSSPDFEQQLRQAIQRFQPRLFLDAVAGEQCGQVASLLPPDSRVVVYGGLSGKEISGISALQLIFKKLIISGFDLNAWFAAAGSEKVSEVSRQLSQIIRNNEVQNRVAITVGLDELAKGLRHYLGAMSEGKMLIRF